MSDSDSSDDVDMLTLLNEVNEYVRHKNEAGSSREVHKRRVIERKRVEAHERLLNDYFVENPKYTPEIFKRRFRMNQRLFLRILEGITTYSEEPLPEHFSYFHQKPNALGFMGFSPILKMTSALRQLAYGTSADACDEYLQMSERVSRESLHNFCRCIIKLYGNVYMREPTTEDILRLYSRHESIHGFPGMLGSIDCMHWAWGRCPNAWRGQFTRGDHGYPTVMLEAVASYDLWIWHAYFGVAGANNDLNVLNSSPLFRSLLNDTAPQIPFVVNDVGYDRGYYLADGIYPSWASFVKGFSSVADQKRTHFTNKQSSARKDVERTFGVLQGRWGILQQPARAYSQNVLKIIMYACIILHNMIIEDNGFNIAESEEFYVPVANRQRTWHDRCETYKRKTIELRDRDKHEGLRSDLVEHLWENREI